MRKLLALGLILISLWGCSTSPSFDKQEVQVHKNLAEVFIQNNQYTRALNELKLALAQNPCDPEIYNLLGLAYMGKYEYAKAEECFRKAIALKKNFSEAYTNLGALMMLEHKYTLAIKYFKDALKNPCYLNSYIALTNLGWAYFKLGETKKAIDALLTAYRQNPRYPRVLIYLGLIHMEKGNLKFAEFYFKQALKLNDTSGEARYYLAEVLFRQGKKSLAKKLWQSIIFLDPDSKWANKATARLYLLERTS